MAINGVIVLLMSGFILYDTSHALFTAAKPIMYWQLCLLYLDILNLFTSLLQLLGFFNNDD